MENVQTDGSESPFCWKVDSVIARDKPQAVLDWLVGQGVLDEFRLNVTSPGGKEDVISGYRVVQPHKHEWRVYFTNSVEVRVRCGDEKCDQTRTMPNRLPIEVPE